MFWTSSLNVTIFNFYFPKQISCTWSVYFAFHREFIEAFDLFMLQIKLKSNEKRGLAEDWYYISMFGHKEQHLFYSLRICAKRKKGDENNSWSRSGAFIQESPNRRPNRLLKQILFKRKLTRRKKKKEQDVCTTGRLSRVELLFF